MQVPQSELYKWNKIRPVIKVFNTMNTRIKLWPQILMKSLLNQRFFHKSSISQPLTSTIKWRLWLTNYIFLLLSIMPDTKWLRAKGLRLWWWCWSAFLAICVCANDIGFTQVRLLSETAMGEVRRHVRRLKIPLHSFSLSVAAPTLNK